MSEVFAAAVSSAPTRRLRLVALLMPLIGCASPDAPRGERGEREQASSSAATCPTGMTRVDGDGENGDFCLDALEVSALEYRHCVDSGVCSPAVVGDGHGCRFFGSLLEHPVNCVDSRQAGEYCRWRGRRLPSDREWQWAAHGGARRTAFPWGDVLEPGRACVQRPASEQTCERGAFEDVSPHGIHDLVGNVAEWTLEGDEAGLRGGSWRDPPSLDASEPRAKEASEASGIRCAAPLGTSDRPWPKLRGERVARPLEHRRLSLAPTWPPGHIDVMDSQWLTDGRWTELSDGQFIPFAPAEPQAFGLPRALAVAALPLELRACRPLHGSLDVVIFYCPAALDGPRLVGAARAGWSIRWRNPYRGREPAEAVRFGDETFVVFTAEPEPGYLSFGELFGYSLGTGQARWQLTTERPEDRVWLSDAGVYWSNSRRNSVSALDPRTGGVIWTAAADCGLVRGDALYIEDSRGVHRLSPQTGEVTATFGGPRRGCTAVDDREGVRRIVGGKLFDFAPGSAFERTMVVSDLATGELLWQRAKVEPSLVAVIDDAVYVVSEPHTLLVLDPSTGATLITLTTDVVRTAPRAYAVGGALGPLIIVEGYHHALTLGRSASATVLETYKIRGRLVGRGLPDAYDLWRIVTLDAQDLHVGADGRFTATGTRAVGTRLRIESVELAVSPASVTLDGRGAYDLGTIFVEPKR